MGTMKDSFKTIALLVCGAVLMAGFSNNAFTVKQVEARSSSVEPVQKWDFLTVFIQDVGEPSESWTLRHDNGVVLNLENKFELDTLKVSLGSLGKDGWELVNGSQMFGGWWYYFKRPFDEKEDKKLEKVLKEQEFEKEQELEREQGAMAPVSGIVTLDGKPLSGIRVTFWTNSPIFSAYSTAVTDSKGNFSLVDRYFREGAEVGRHKIEFEWDELDESAPPFKIPKKYEKGGAGQFVVDVPSGGLESFALEMTSK
jgi:hypothetical protein